MRVVDILKEELIVPQLQSQTKTEVLRELAFHLAEHHPEINPEQLVTVLLERERLGTTAIGEGIAIPHGKLPGLNGVVAAFGVRSKMCLSMCRMQGSFGSRATMVRISPVRAKNPARASPPRYW